MAKLVKYMNLSTLYIEWSFLVNLVKICYSNQTY